MAALIFFLLFLTSSIPLLVSSSSSSSSSNTNTNTNTYIVFMNPSHKPSIYPTSSHWYSSHLQSLSIDPSLHLLYSYSHSLSGFSAHLLPHHLPLLRSSPSVLLILPDPLLHLHTTRSPYFLHLPPSPSPSPSRDVIIGILDTGVWPELPSFSDTNLAPVPSRWKGECEAGVDFAPSSACNRKLIGARSFSRGSSTAQRHTTATQPEYASARDRDGHGTHTASTAGGMPVANASLLGYAPGTARGMAPAARIAAYKVCWESGCYGSDILAGIDSAIEDGVDVLSLSLGGGNAPFYRDPIAVGAFAAVQKGIFVSCSAGNSGPGMATLTNTAPWLATVGAGTLDRDFPAFVVLGNGEKVTGVSLYSGKGMGKKLVPVVYGNGKGKGNSNNSSKLCLAGSLDPKLVKGKVVFCDRGISSRVEKGLAVKQAGGIGMILANTAANGEELVADSHILPAVAVGLKEGDRIKQYVASAGKPVAVLSFGGTVLNVRPSPVVAAFSSRGPNAVTPEILKPDLIGPGMNILAGWSGSIGPTGLQVDDRRSQFNIMSGTSMSCPHISGVAALLKAAHPAWSPAAIKSALMTTSYTVDNTGSPLRDASGGSLATPLAYGAGHVDPQKALSPGLVYDTTTQDYIAFLCSTGSTIQQIQAISKDPNATCSQKLTSPGNLNYPSFSVVFSRKSRVRYSRELTNVGSANSVYTVNYTGPADVSVTIKPTKLVFKGVGQKLRYTVSFTSKKGKAVSSDMAFGWIQWSNSVHRVRSPVSYSWRAFM